ncbi:MAG: winged helix-turn-helix domain-containing protein [Tannerella sp.]|jgi:ATP-dependent DNA helicase RecG|nr:winged helix-turn-helix domain-containing protein [Tannerella sp.]
MLHLTPEFTNISEGFQVTVFTATTEKTTEKILKLIMDNPQISQDKIAEIIGITTDGVFWNIKKLKAQGVIERVGHDKGGYWKMIGL